MWVAVINGHAGGLDLKIKHKRNVSCTITKKTTLQGNIGVGGNLGEEKRADHLASHASGEVHLAVAGLVGLHVQQDGGGELVGGSLARVLDLHDVNGVPGTLHLLRALSDWKTHEEEEKRVLGVERRGKNETRERTLLDQNNSGKASVKIPHVD